MTLNIDQLATIGSFIIGLALAVWKITATSNGNKEELQKSITALRLSINTIEIETKHVRSDHDKVVQLDVKVEKAQKDLNGLGNRLRETTDHVSAWGQEISKITRR